MTSSGGGGEDLLVGFDTLTYREIGDSIAFGRYSQPKLRKRRELVAVLKSSKSKMMRLCAVLLSFSAIVLSTTCPSTYSWSPSGKAVSRYSVGDTRVGMAPMPLV